MVRPYQILLPLLSLFFVRVDLTDLIPLNIPVKVLKIYDGDTVLVRHGNYQMKLRFAKIDSPEKGQPFFGSKRDAGEYSKKCLEKILDQTKFHTLIIEKHDIYRRVLGELDDLSYRLIQNGCTTLYPHASFSSRKEKLKYLIALKKAKASKRGLWQYGGFRQPKLWRKFNKLNVVRRLPQ